MTGKVRSLGVHGIRGYGVTRDDLIGTTLSRGSEGEAVARLQARLLHGEDGAASQRAAKDILDRAGISTEADATREIRITFAGMPKLGMPKAQEEQSDDGCNA